MRLVFIAIMNTSYKVHLSDRNEESLPRTKSGGVQHPFDASHYPALSTSAGAEKTNSSPARRLSRLSTSFKEAVACDAPTTASPSSNDGVEASDVGKTVNTPKMQALGSPSRSSPRIFAERRTEAPARQRSGDALEQDSRFSSPRQQVQPDRDVHRDVACSA